MFVLTHKKMCYKNAVYESLQCKYIKYVFYVVFLYIMQTTNVTACKFFLMSCSTTEIENLRSLKIMYG